MGSGGALLRQQKQAKRKNFHSLKEKFLGRGQIRIWKIFSFCFSVVRRSAPPRLVGCRERSERHIRFTKSEIFDKMSSSGIV